MPTEGLTVSGITLCGRTEKQRTLWRTHSVVCRRCKARAESLRQMDREERMFTRIGFFGSPRLGTAEFLQKEGIYYADETY